MLQDFYDSVRSLKTFSVTSKQCQFVVQVLSLGDALRRYIEVTLNATRPATRALWVFSRTLRLGC